MHLDNQVIDLIEKAIAPEGTPEDFAKVWCYIKNDLDNVPAVVHYWACREKGTPRKLAEMFALAQPPQSQTDVEFLRGADRQFTEGPLANKMGDFYREVAESQGQCTKGKVYKSGLALYPGDPRAWVADRHEVQKVVEERNWTSTGDVQHKSDNSRESA